MNLPFRRVVLLALAMAGCHQAKAPHFPPMLVPITPDKGRCGPHYGERICGYLPLKREGEAEREQYDCWNQPGQFHCVGCGWEGRLDCHLQLPAEVKVGQPVPLTIRLRNVSNKTLRVDPEDMPLTPGQFNITTFHVHCDGHDEPWTASRHAGRQGGGGRTDFARYLVIPPGGFIENEINLQPVFRGMRGSCMVHWHGTLWDVIDSDHPRAPGAPAKPVDVTCNWAMTRVEP